MIGTDAFRNLLRMFPSGVTVVTTRDAEGHEIGATVSSFALVSLSPPMVSVNLLRGGRTHRAMMERAEFAVNILRDDQREVAERFACPGNGDRFQGLDTHECPITEGGVPVLCGALANIVCRTMYRHEAGGHTIFLAMVIGGHARSGDPLLYCRSTFGVFKPWD